MKRNLWLVICLLAMCILGTGMQGLAQEKKSRLIEKYHMQPLAFKPQSPRVTPPPGSDGYDYATQRRFFAPQKFHCRQNWHTLGMTLYGGSTYIPDPTKPRLFDRKQSLLCTNLYLHYYLPTPMTISLPPLENQLFSRGSNKGQCELRWPPFAEDWLLPIINWLYTANNFIPGDPDTYYDGNIDFNRVSTKERLRWWPREDVWCIPIGGTLAMQIPPVDAGFRAFPPTYRCHILQARTVDQAWVVDLEVIQSAQYPVDRVYEWKDTTWKKTLRVGDEVEVFGYPYTVWRIVPRDPIEKVIGWVEFIPTENIQGAPLPPQIFPTPEPKNYPPPPDLPEDPPLPPLPPPPPIADNSRRFAPYHASTAPGWGIPWNTIAISGAVCVSGLIWRKFAGNQT